MLIDPTADFDFPQLDVDDIDKPFEIAAALEARGVPYVFGGKVQDMSEPIDEVGPVDCSGFTGLCMWHMTEGAVKLEGKNSQDQGAWAAEQGFKEDSPEDATNMDGHLYLFMLPSDASSDGIGHVGFVRNSVTAESYGGHGPGSRPWGPDSPSWGWQEHCKTWVLRLGD